MAGQYAKRAEVSADRSRSEIEKTLVKYGATGDELAEQLAIVAGIARDLQAYIEARADEIAGPLITATQERAAERVAEVERNAAFEKQRHADLEKELRRQLDAAVKSRDREHAELKELREMRKRVIQRLTVQATGADGQRWADYDALFTAVWPEAGTEVSSGV